MTAGLPVLNLCRLCLQGVSVVGPLQQSHIIPRFLLKRSKGPDGKAMVYRLKDDKAQLSQFDWKEPMLCKKCEDLMQAHENLIQETLFLRRKKPALLDSPTRLVLSVESDKLATAFMSIFWRALESDQAVFYWTRVPPYLAEEFRGGLLAGYLEYRWSRHVSIRVQQLKAANGMTMEFLVSPFVRMSPKEGVPFEYVFIFGGFCVTFSIPVWHYPKTKALQPNSPTVQIDKIRYEQIPELRTLVGKMLAAGGTRKIRQSSGS